MTLHVSKNNFAADVLGAKEMVLVDFYADWCGPCKLTAPIIEELSNEVKDVRFAKVNVDVDTELATTYQVFSIPTFIIFKNGKSVGQFVGAQSKENFLKEIEKARAAS